MVGSLGANVEGGSVAEQRPWSRNVKAAATIGAMVASLLLIVVVANGLISKHDFDRDAAVLCRSLDGEYRAEATVNVISSTSPGLDAAEQVDRAKDMARARCPGNLNLIYRAASYTGY